MRVCNDPEHLALVFAEYIQGGPAHEEVKTMDLTDFSEYAPSRMLVVPRIAGSRRSFTISVLGDESGLPPHERS